MKELIKQNEFGISVLDKDKSVVVSSLSVAKIFEKEHYNVIKDINKLNDELSNCTTNLGAVKFYGTSYTDIQGKKRPMYLLNRDAFTLLVMGYNGKKALNFKLWYINRFNEMEERLHNLEMCRLDCRKLTDALLANGKNKWYHYSNEFNMINSLVLGMSTKKFKELNGIPEDTKSLRPWLTAGQLQLIEDMQLYDSVLVDMVSDFNTRKSILKSKFIDEKGELNV